MACQPTLAVPRHVGVLRIPGPAGANTYYGRSYVSPTALTGQEEGVDRGFESELWIDDGSEAFEAMYARVHGGDEAQLTGNRSEDAQDHIVCVPAPKL